MIEYKLDMMYSSFLEEKHDPVKIDLKDSVDVREYSDDAFLLKPLTGSIKTTVNKLESDKDFLIIRTVIGYKQSEILSNNYSKGVFFLSNLKNEMLNVASEYFDLSKCKEITFKRFPSGNTFVSLENVAGCELRLYVRRNLAKDVVFQNEKT